MTASDSLVGIDISKGRLEVAVTPGDQTFTHPNRKTVAQKATGEDCSDLPKLIDS